MSASSHTAAPAFSHGAASASSRGACQDRQPSEDEEESGITEVLPAPISGLQSMMLLTLVAVAYHRREEPLEVEFE